MDNWDGKLDPPAPQIPRGMMDTLEHASAMTDVELMMVLGPILTILAKRRGVEFVRKAIEKAMETLQAEAPRGR